MAKTNINFNNTTYRIDESSLAVATAELQSHLSTVMNGTGAEIHLGGTVYNVDASKLSNTTNALISHLGTIAGNGTKVVVNGVVYNVDSTKMSGAVADLETVLGGMNAGGGEDDSNIITWDGNTEGLLTVSIDEGLAFYKVSDKVFSDEQLKMMSVTFYDTDAGEEQICYLGDEWDGLIASGRVTDDVAQCIGVTIVRKAGATMDGALFPEVGTYFIKEEHLDDGYLYYITSFSDDSQSGGGDASFAPGLYQTGAIALCNEQGSEAIDGMMIKSWDELVNDGVVGVEDGVVYTPFDSNEWVNPSSDALAGDLILPCDGSINQIGDGYWPDDGGDYVGHFGFTLCANLTGVLIPDGVIRIIDNAFEGCSSLTSVNIPDGVTDIGACAFMECSSLTYIVIPTSTTNIGSGVFSNCASLVEIVLPDGINIICSNLLSGCWSLTTIHIPTSVTIIEECAFSGAGLTSVNIPNGVVSIENAAFSNSCNLTTVIIPNSVMSIGHEALAYCENLTNITFHGTIAQWNEISKTDYWNAGTPATHVTCSDGQVALK